MFKRNTVQASILSALALTMLCVCSSVATAQKVTPSTDSSVRPVKGIDVVVLKNTGNSAARIVPTDKDGNADFGILAAGNYSVRLKRVRSAITITKEWGAQIKEVMITIAGATAGQKSRVWHLATGTFHAPEQSTAKTTDTPSFHFTTDGHGPIIFNTSISKSRSKTGANGWDGKVQGKQLSTQLVVTFDNPNDYDNFAAGKLRLNLILRNTLSGQTITLGSNLLTENFRPGGDKKSITVNVVIDNMSAPLSEATCGQIMQSAESSGDSTVNITLSYGACGVEQKSRGMSLKGSKGIIVGNGGSGYRTQKTAGNLNIMLGDTGVMTREAVAGLPRGPGMITLSSSKGAGSSKAAGF